MTEGVETRKRGRPRQEKPAEPAAAWRNRIVGAGTEAPEQLLANPRNWRTHPAAQRDALRGSLDWPALIAGLLLTSRARSPSRPRRYMDWDRAQMPPVPDPAFVGAVSEGRRR